MTLEAIALFVAVPVFVAVGVQGLFAPLRIVKPLGGTLASPSFTNEIRANYGGMHLGIAGLLLTGALLESWRVPMLALLAVFSLGLCVGRAVSWIADGPPNGFVRMFFALEALAVVGAGLLLARNLGG